MIPEVVPEQAFCEL